MRQRNATAVPCGRQVSRGFDPPTCMGRVLRATSPLLRRPVPPLFSSSRPTYATQLECCLGAYRGQKSDNCLGELLEPPTLSPTRITDSPSEAPSVGKPWYPDFETEWTEAGCLDTLPFPFPHESRRTYTREIDCCKKEYNGQRSNACMCQSDTLSDKQKLKKCPDFDPNERP